MLDSTQIENAEMDAANQAQKVDDTALEPQRITIPATSFPAASTTYLLSFKQLHRNAKRRLCIVSMDASMGQYVNVSLLVWDSAAPLPSDGNHYRGTAASLSNIDGYYLGVVGSGDSSNLANPGDTLCVVVANGATPNATGNLYIDLIEVI